jgi:hypothetical protein
MRRPEHSPDRYTGPHHVVGTDGQSIEAHTYPENAAHAVEVLNAHNAANGHPMRYHVETRERHA